MTARIPMAFAALFALALLLGCSDEKTLDADVEVKDVVITIANNSSTDWHNVDITVNGEYTATEDVIAGGGSLDMIYAMFTNDAGKEFLIAEQGVERIAIKADEGTFEAGF